MNEVSEMREMSDKEMSASVEQDLLMLLNTSKIINEKTIEKFN